MIVQWCIKGMSMASDTAARRIIDRNAGLLSNWWRDVGTITPAERRGQLTAYNLNLHVNHFNAQPPGSENPFSKTSPFISLSSGVVERDTYAQTNFIHRARRTALWFGSGFGEKDVAYLYTCWVILAPRPCIGIESVAEEVRDLNSYRRYSPFQTEGEIVAKINIPDNQVHSCEKWRWDRTAGLFFKDWTYENPTFSAPEELTNVRELI